MLGNEKTPLRINEPERTYVYMSSYKNQAYRTKIKQFQCCAYTTLVGAWVLALVLALSYVVDHEIRGIRNEMTGNPTTSQKQQNLLTSVWPKPFWSNQFPKISLLTSDGVGRVETALKDGAPSLTYQGQLFGKQRESSMKLEKNNEDDDFAMAPENLMINATVVGGNITGSYDLLELHTLWEGEFPVQIKAPFFDKVTRQIPFQMPTPKEVEYRGGFLWGGNYKKLPNGNLYLSAKFYLPITPPNQGPISIREWWSGNAEIEAKINWSSGDIYDLPENNYFTPAYFKQEKGKFLRMLQASANLDQIDPSTLLRIPINLSGQYNDDNSAFWWNGDVNIVLPKVQPNVIKTPKKLLTSSKEAENLLIKMSNKKINNSKETALELRSDEINYIERFYVLGGQVTSGEAYINGSKYWGGSFPLEIGIPNPNIKDDEHEGSVMIRSIIHGKFYNYTIDTLKFNGSVSIALYHPDTEITKWAEGPVSLNIDIDWTSDYMGLVTSIDKWHCIIYLRERPKEKVVLDVEKLISTIPKVSDTFTPALIILDGYYVGKNDFVLTGRIDFAMISDILDIPKPN